MRFGLNIILDNPQKSEGNNPDVLFTYKKQRLGIACKVIQSDSANAYLDRLEDGTKQIERSEAERGFVLFNWKNILPHNEVLSLDEDKCKEGNYIYYKSWVDETYPETLLKNFVNNKTRQMQENVRKRKDMSKIFQRKRGCQIFCV